MKIAKLIGLFMFLASASVYAVPVTDTVSAPTGFFTPVGGETDSPYYRGFGEDWGWTHGAIAGGFTSALLNISAYDVDEAPCGQGTCEVDNIYARDVSGGVWLLLGALTGDDDMFSFTEFDIFTMHGGALIDDVIAGLQVGIEIDVLNAGWLVSLAKSVITTDGAPIGNPNPVSSPALGGLMLIAFGGLLVARRRKSK